MSDHFLNDLVLDRRNLLLAAGGTASLLLTRTGAQAKEATKLVVHSETPRNSEPRLEDLVRAWITPNALFYVRSHAPVPEVDVASFQLRVGGLVRKPLNVNLEQLKANYKQHSTVATMTCAGNRRSEHSLVKQVSGVPWMSGAIGNASWEGALLADILRRAEIKEGARYVWFDGVDEIRKNDDVIPFGASIPLAKAMLGTDSAGPALVAHAMNGQPLSPDHGFPMRTVVPGYIGARSVKWLGKITVSDRPSPNHYVANAYKLVTEGSKTEWDSASPIGVFPINSVTCIPSGDAPLKAGMAAIAGYALPTGEPGRIVTKVELSLDEGKNWMPTRFDSPARPYCWRLWSAKVRLSTRCRSILVRATDSAGNVQPRRVAWNLKGYLFNAWHRTPVKVQG